MRIPLALIAMALFASSAVTYAQSSGTIRGSVLDPSGAVIAGANVTIQNPVSHYSQSTKSDSQGNFDFPNVPFNPYHLTATASGFQAASQDVDVRSAIPTDVKLNLKLGEATTTVTVESSADLVENDPTTHTDVDRNLFDKLPLESASSSLSSLVTLASPGVSADSNGLFHGLGDHAENSFSIDGQPITDQQSKVFSNQLPSDAVQSMEVIEGAPPAEYGDKTSLVIVVTTRSGLGVKQPHGEITTSYGTFGTATGGANVGYGGDKWGNFISVSGLNTGRFLDGPEYQTFHDHGNEQNLFDRFDLKPTQSDTISLNFQFTRSWFQTPNSYDAQTADAWSGLVADNGGLGPNGEVVGPADQRSKIRTFNISPTYTRLINPNTVFTLGAFVRQDQYNYYPSRDPFSDLVPGLQLTTVGQDRRLTNIGGRAEISYLKGIHNLKAGLLFTDTLLTENTSFGIVDPTFNAVCLNPDGSPYTGATPNDPNNCSGDASGESRLRSSLGLPRFDQTGTVTGLERLPHYKSQPLYILGSRQCQGISNVCPRYHHQEQLDVQPRLAIRLLRCHHSYAAGRASPRGRIQRQAHWNGDPRLLRPRVGDALQRKPGPLESGM